MGVQVLEFWVFNPNSTQEFEKGSYERVEFFEDKSKQVVKDFIRVPVVRGNSYRF